MINRSRVTIPIVVLLSDVCRATYFHPAVVPIDRYIHQNDAFAFSRSPDSSTASLLTGGMRV